MQLGMRTPLRRPHLLLANGLVNDWEPAQGIDRVRAIAIDPTAQIWLRNHTYTGQAWTGTGGLSVPERFTTPGGAAYVYSNAVIGTRTHSSHYIGGTTGLVEPAGTGTVVDGTVAYGIAAGTVAPNFPFGGNRGAWQASTAYGYNDRIHEDGAWFIQNTFTFTSFNSSGSKPNFAGVAYGGSVTEGSISWVRFDAAPLWTPDTLYSYQVTPGTNFFYTQFPRFSDERWGSGTLGIHNFGLSGSAQPTDTANAISDHAVLWGPSGSALPEKLVLTGLAEPVQDGHVVQAKNVGSGSAYVILADQTGLAGTDGESGFPFDFGGTDVSLAAGDYTLVQYAAGSGMWVAV